MTPVLALVACWLAGAALLPCDGRRRRAAVAAGAVLAAVLGLDVVFLARQAQGAAAYEITCGGWPAGVGIRLRADVTALAFGALTTAVLGGALLRSARKGIDAPLFPALIVLQCAALHGAFLTADLFDFYVFFELSVVTSFGLAAYGLERARLRAVFLYVAANLMGSALFLIGVAVIYHTHGTLDLDALAELAPGRQGLLGGTLIFSALALKMGLFPFHGWVVVLYRNVRPAVAAALSGALANLGAYGLLRLGGSALAEARDILAPVLIGLGVLAALYGALLALHRSSAAEAAACSAITHAGYVVLAVGIAGAVGHQAALLVVLAGSLDKASMFLSLEAAPWARDLAAAAAAGSAAGLPPTAGFAAKVLLFRATLEAPAGWAVAGGLLVASLLALCASLRFLRLARRRTPVPRVGGRVPVVFAALTIGIGLWPEPWARLAARAAAELAGGAS